MREIGVRARIYIYIYIYMYVQALLERERPPFRACNELWRFVYTSVRGFLEGGRLQQRARLPFFFVVVNTECGDRGIFEVARGCAGGKRSFMRSQQVGCSGLFYEGIKNFLFSGRDDDDGGGEFGEARCVRMEDIF